MAAEKIFLYENITESFMVPFLLDGSKSRPCVLVIPGGGYGCVCEKTEGSPIARKFNELGWHAVVLNYRVAPHRWPEPQLDAMRAMKLIRANAENWHIDQSQVAVCGFSAGAHLAGSLGILCDDLDASVGDAADSFTHRPDLMILCYGVLAFAPWSHIGTQSNLLGDDFAAAADFSLPERVNENTPPTFLMHTICDPVVPFGNSIEFAKAMAAHQRPCELALNYWGEHGMLLGKNTLDVVNWPQQAVDFAASLKMSVNDSGFAERYTGVYQSQQI